MTSQMSSKTTETGGRAIDAILFYSLLALIPLVAIPYGGVQPWWKSVFQCVVFTLSALSIVQKLISGKGWWDRAAAANYQVFWPILALIVFAFLQTIPVPTPIIGGTSGEATLSADPYRTREFVIQLLAFALYGWLLIGHANTRRRVRYLIDVVVAVGIISALYGILRQVSQHAPGFGLPYLLPGHGYAQFVNPNHFAFLMEMSLGLGLGVAVCRGVSGKRQAIYLMAAVPMWIALVLANSKGGILSILCQVLFLGLLLSAYRRQPEADFVNSKGSRLRVVSSFAARSVLLLALLVGATMTVVLVGGDPLARRVDSLTNELERSRDDSFTTRPSIWRTTWKLIKDHPVAGVGFGGYWIAITKYHAASGESTPQEAHNDYLELLASGGVIGLALGVWFVTTLVRVTRRKIQRAGSYNRAITLGALAGIVTVAIHSLVDFGLHIPINALVLTVLVSLCCMSVRSDRALRPRKSEVDE